MSRLCRLKTKSHGDDGRWAYDEITRLRQQVATLAYAAGQASKQEWQPIETAPKDGTAVFVLLIGSDIPHPARFENGEWRMTWDRYALSDWDGPTHWMPLPAAPSQEGGADAAVDLNDDFVGRIDDAITEALGDAMDCTRVWSAWGYGTMGEDDFVRVADDPVRVMEIRDAVLRVVRATEEGGAA